MFGGFAADTPGADSRFIFVRSYTVPGMEVNGGQPA